MRDEQSKEFLYLIWKDPQTRRNYIVGRLLRGNEYRFEYCEENESARKAGWQGIPAFSDSKTTYSSKELFPTFSSRLPDPKRRDIHKILKKYELDAYDEYELLRRSGARLPIDTYEFIDPIFPEDVTIQRDFYVMGIRHRAACQGENCSALPSVQVDDLLTFKPEPDNENDSMAIRILTTDGSHLGYVPRYFNRGILERLNKRSSYSCRVLEVNQDSNCSECVKVRLNIPSELDAAHHIALQSRYNIISK